MKFFSKSYHLFHKSQQHNFESISGYSDVKDIVNRALQSEENFNLLFIGPPASSKTQFLMEIMKSSKNCVYFDASNTTNRILQVLEEERPEIVLLDELDKMSRQFAEKLLNFLESGRVKVDQKNLQLDFELKGCKVFGTANDLNKLSKPLQSRFRKLFLPKYSREQFVQVAVKVCPKLPNETASMVGEEVFKIDGDIRDVISTGKLLKKYDGPNEIRSILNTPGKYGAEFK
jgi:replication-associated recombination protein RarA